jgi:hypothetical protein
VNQHFAPEVIMTFLTLSTLLVSLMALACGGSSGGQATSTVPSKQAASANDPSCPVSVPGTSVTVEDAPGGAALVFVTTGDVADLRRRAAAMASMHNEHHQAMGPLPDGSDTGSGHAGHDMSGHADHAAGGGHAEHGNSGSGHEGHAGGMIGVHSKALASDIDGGAKITFVANSADTAKLHGELRMHAQHLAAGTCRMERS